MIYSAPPTFLICSRDFFIFIPRNANKMQIFLALGEREKDKFRKVSLTNIYGGIRVVMSWGVNV